MNCAVELLNESNPKLVMIGFDSMQTIMESNSEAFQPLLNFSFDTVITRFTDNKVLNFQIHTLILLKNSYV